MASSSRLHASLPPLPPITAENCVPESVMPEPAVYVPAPENCVHGIAVVPSVPPWSAVQVQPVLPFTVPCSTKQNAPGTSLQLSMSLARVHAPVDDDPDAAQRGRRIALVEDAVAADATRRRRSSARRNG